MSGPEIPYRLSLGGLRAALLGLSDTLDPDEGPVILAWSVKRLAEALYASLTESVSTDAADGEIESDEVGTEAPSEFELARITIRHFIAEDGQRLVAVDQDNGDGANLPVVEALGLLQLAIWDVCNGPAEPAP